MTDADATTPAGEPDADGESGRLDAFLSYSHDDRERAARLRGALADRAIAVWTDEADIPGGSRSAGSAPWPRRLSPARTGPPAGRPRG